MSFQQSYPQFIGTASKDHEKQRLTRDFKNIYEQENDKMHGPLQIEASTQRTECKCGLTSQSRRLLTAKWVVC